MKILAQGVNDDGSLVSCVIASGGRDEPSDLRITQRPVSQVAQGLRWSYAKMFDRGNTVTEITFQISKTHATTMAAEIFALTYRKSIPRKGNVYMTIAVGNSLGSFRQLIDAIIDMETVAIIGVTTVHQFTITGGEVT